MIPLIKKILAVTIEEIDSLSLEESLMYQEAIDEIQSAANTSWSLFMGFEITQYTMARAMMRITSYGGKQTTIRAEDELHFQETYRFFAPPQTVPSEEPVASVIKDSAKLYLFYSKYEKQLATLSTQLTERINLLQEEKNVPAPS